MSMPDPTRPAPKETPKSVYGCLWSLFALGILGATAFYYRELDRRIEHLEVMRTGVPFAILPLGDRKPSRETKLNFEGKPMTAYEFKSSARGPANSHDMFYIVNQEGIVVAAWSMDIEGGRDVAMKLLKSADPDR